MFVNTEIANCYQPLFDLMSKEHDLILEKSELDEIIKKSMEVKKNIDSKAINQQFNKGDAIKFSIKRNGSPIINQGYIREIGKNIVALDIDLKSKYCDASHSFGGTNISCGIYINANERSLYLNEKVKRDMPTAIEFTDFVGWNVFACRISRYTLSVCLIKKELL